MKDLPNGLYKDSKIKKKKCGQGQLARLRRGLSGPSGRFLCLFVGATMVFAACYTTSSVPVRDLQQFFRGNAGKELVLRDDRGGRVRVGPNSKIRFLFNDGTRTRWYEGRRLQVNNSGAFIGARGGYRYAVARWDEVYGIQIRNLSGGKTYGAVFAIAVVLGVVVLLIFGKGKGGGKGLGKGFGKLFKGTGKAMARGLRGMSRIRAPVRVRVGIHIAPRYHHPHPGYVHPGGPHVDVGPGSPDSLSPHVSPGTPPAPGATPPPSAGAVPPGAAPPAPPAPQPAAQPGPPLPAFSRLVRRRAKVKYLAVLDGGSDFLIHDGMNLAAFLGFRFYDVFEIAGGARMLLHRPEPETGERESLRGSWMGVGRLGVHFDLDANRRVALPLGAEVGAGHAQIYVKANVGIRVRLWRWLSIGLYPFNPTYIRFKDNDLKRKFDWWTFPTNFEVTFAF